MWENTTERGAAVQRKSHLNCNTTANKKIWQQWEPAVFITFVHADISKKWNQQQVWKGTSYYIIVHGRVEVIIGALPERGSPSPRKHVSYLHTWCFAQSKKFPFLQAQQFHFLEKPSVHQRVWSDLYGTCSQGRNRLTQHLLCQYLRLKDKWFSCFTLQMNPTLNCNNCDKVKMHLLSPER